jgi:hypothetical protein
VVTFVGEEYIGVEFEGGSHALLKRESFVFRPEEGAGGHLEEEAPAEPLPWPASTFVPERPDAKHFMGSHWEPFFDGADTVLNPDHAPRLGGRGAAGRGKGHRRPPVAARPPLVSQDLVSRRGGAPMITLHGTLMPSVNWVRRWRGWKR